MLEYHISDLLDLIRLGHRSFGPEVQNLLDAVAGEDMMVTSYSLIESKVQQKLNKIGEADIRIGPPIENTTEKLRVFPHATSLHLTRSGNRNSAVDFSSAGQANQ